jgi:predicted ATP-dependent endonuclease of OLD family
VAVVGANNAGKSNLIAAVRLALGTAPRADLDPADFHHARTSQSVVSVRRLGEQPATDHHHLEQRLVVGVECLLGERPVRLVGSQTPCAPSLQG